MEICERCGADLQVGMFPFCKGSQSDHGTSLMRSGNGVFPFETTHVNGAPMRIESMQQLRKVEQTYGVCFSAFSKSNINDLDPIKNPPTFRGNHPERF